MKGLKSFLTGKAMRTVYIVLVIAGVGVGGYFTYKNINKSNAQSTSNEITAKVTRGDLDVTITGTGTIEPISRYDIVPLVKGNILSAPFEEGMQVKQGDLLYKIDDSDLSFNIQKAQNGIEKIVINNQQAVDNLKDLNVKAAFEGRIINFTTKVGEQVNGKVADLVDDKHLKVLIPFVESQVKDIKVGQNAQLKVVDDLMFIDGKVTDVSSTPSYTNTGAKVYNVEITVENSGLNVGTSVNGIVKGPYGDIFSYFTGSMEYGKQQPVIANSSGKVKKVLVNNNEWVKADQKILELENDTLNDTIYKNSLDIKDSQLSLDAQKKQLNDYNILSPINGTIIKKNFKTGDTINNGNNSTTLMTVADLSKMVFNIEVDELDIAKVANGQKVDITADALPGAKLVGEVTNISLEGKSQNGVTTYPVQVTISEPGKLMPGMNVNAKILVESKKNVLFVPVSAVTKMGDKSFVFVKGSGAAQKETAAQAGEVRQNARKRSNNAASADNQGANNQSGNIRQPSNNNDRQRKEVVVGINNDNFIEIVSGLNEGDTVVLPQQAVNRTQPNGPGMMAMPAGGFGGGGNRQGGVTIRR